MNSSQKQEVQRHEKEKERSGMLYDRKRISEKSCRRRDDKTYDPFSWGGKKNMKEPVLDHVAGYIRLSREDGDKAESDSIINQKKLISAYLKEKKEFLLYDTYVDDGYSGTNFNEVG